MKTISQTVVIVWIALALEIQAWKYEYAGILIVPLAILCFFGIWLIRGGGYSSPDRSKAYGRMLLGLGAFGIGAVLHVFRYDWDVAVQESFFASLLALACAAAVIVLGAAIVAFMRNRQRRELTTFQPSPKAEEAREEEEYGPTNSHPRFSA